MIDFKRGHTAIVGMTGTGKTHAGRKALARWRGGVLFINTMHGDVPRGFIRATGDDELAAIIAALDGGEKVAFNPSRSSAGRDAQADVLIGELFRTKRRDIIIAADEIHLYDPKPFIEVATTGRQWGLTLVSITQRLARLHNDIMTQSPQKVIFCLENEEKYCAGYGIPYPEIEQRNKAKSPPKEHEPSHGYCVWYAGQLHGAYVA